MKRIQRSGAVNRKLKKQKEEEIENGIKKKKCISSFFKSDRLQNENKASELSETIVNSVSMNVNSTVISTNINDTSVEKIKSLNAEILTIDSQISENISFVLNEENSNNVDSASHHVKLDQVPCSPQIQDGSETETIQNSPFEIMTDIGL